MTCKCKAVRENERKGGRTRSTRRCSTNRLGRRSHPEPLATWTWDAGFKLADLAADLSFVVSVIPEPATFRHVLPSGGWRLRLAATIQNGDATFWDARVSYGVTFSAGIAQLIDAKATVVKVASASAPPARG